ncbi:hypothetical protein SAMN05421823_10535 [Catalinimonas alkaloidigena]|uniref:Uncharacterized protein n=1 Tax=Catalinimonas alkaloidigena TaxID=1075417 RepID=A0A1G9ILP4_9BACT|nr:hypothetical protein [Catalinimonas alkaloidigena]SDL25823.1 hypothetical protein SAMN05421823_10535 [Catalinimonas alkaloidigena]
MKEYRIDPTKIPQYTRRKDNRVFRILLIALLSFPLFALLLPQPAGAPTEAMWTVVAAFLVTGGIVGSIYLNNKKLTRLSAENLRIVLDDASITRTIDLEKEPRMNFLHRFSYQRAKASTGGFDARMSLEEIKGMESRNGDLLIKSKTLTGKYEILIPQELDGFEELEKTLRDKLEANGC